MMKYVFGILILLSVVFAALSGRMSEVSDAALNEGVNAVELTLYMLGGMCVWGGVMRVAEKSGITDKIARLFTKPAKLLFPTLNLNGAAFHAICMNVTANLLGLGNAATPMGLEAMRSLEKEGRTTDTANDNMIVFAVLNTASITLIPTTCASLRLKYGSSAPMEILGGVLMTSFFSLAAALTSALLLNKLHRGKKK